MLKCENCNEIKTEPKEQQQQTNMPHNPNISSVNESEINKNTTGGAVINQKLKGKESSKKYREKIRIRNQQLESELNEKITLNNTLRQRISFLENALKNFSTFYQQELVHILNAKKKSSNTESPSMRRKLILSKMMPRRIKFKN